MRGPLALMTLGLTALASVVGAQERLPIITISVPEGSVLTPFAQDDLGEAYRRIGYGVTIRQLPPARAIEAASAGETDAEAGRAREIGDSYPGLVRVPEPLIELHLQAVTTKPLDLGTGWEGLRGHRLCISLGDKVVESRTTGFEREIVRNLASGAKMLRAGRCEAMIINEYSWLQIDRERLGPLYPSANVIETVQVFHYVNRRHADLVSALAAALHEQREDGTTDRILVPLQRATDEAKARNSCGSGPATRETAAHG
jgi:polar amino acid transport system substrate-binding protein